MADLNTPSEVVAYFRDTIVANHTELQHFVYGDHEALAQTFKNTAKSNEYILFLEWPEKRYQDDGGSIVARLIPQVSILRSVNKQDFSVQNEVIDKCYEILNDILIRARLELFEAGNHFSINELGRIQPIYHLLIDNAFGVRTEIPMGDWVEIGSNDNKWSDRP